MIPNEIKERIEYYQDNISHYFPLIKNQANSFILESKDISEVYGRLSLMGYNPIIKVSGKNEQFEIELLLERGRSFFDAISETDFQQIEDFQKTKNKITGRIVQNQKFFAENERTKQASIVDALRVFLNKFQSPQKTFMGFYGVFAYDFVRLFEDLPNIAEDQGDDDFCFFLYDTFLFFNHLKEQAFKISYHNEGQNLKTIIQETERFQATNTQFDLNQKEFTDLVEKARQLAQEGELFEVVFSRTLKADFQGSAFALYQKYREVNPSPYMFYFDFGGEYLVGASPEMMLRVENGLVHSRPISGTAKRSQNPIEDHEYMLELLASDKERAELDMLIDLARNDLARICEPGIELTEYRTVERYSRVMHTIAHVQGKLKKGFTALDAYIACANAGTLTGAPKVAAMCEIDKHEKTRRGFYGGAVGYLTLSGEMDTGIIIRTAHIKNNKLKLRAGATLLFDSDPVAEFQETENKARAFLDTFQ